MAVAFGLVAALVSPGARAGAPEPTPRMAMGLIVKLKDAKPPSVVRLKASALPSDGFAGQRRRLADAARRKRISYLVQRPTAFAANVIHPGHAVTLAEAEAEAQRLRADPDVEWVVVNEIVGRHALGTNNLPTDPAYARGDATSSTNLAFWLGQSSSAPGPGQVWLQPRATGRAGVADFPAAWSFLEGRTLSPVVVAVLDTGILPHPDLGTTAGGDARILPGYDFVDRVLTSSDGDGVDADPTDTGDWVSADDKTQHPEVFNTSSSPCTVENSSWHGLAIAGMLAANTNNGQYGAGMLAQLRGPDGPGMLIPVRVGGKCGAEVASIIEGMLWASGVSYQGAPALPAHPARVINLSFGGTGACNSSSDSGPIYLQTITTLKNNGVLVVASAGNGSGNRGLPAASIPANCPGVLAVTGLNQAGQKAHYANLISDGVAVASGDVDDPDIHGTSYLADDGIYTLSNSGLTTPNLTSAGYIMAAKAGTSFAAPQAVGVAAMMLAVNPGLSVDQLLTGIKSTAGLSAFPVVTNQTCVAGSNQGSCDCTTATCGQGVLDALQAVTWAASAASSSAATPISSVSYFVPSRVQASRSSGGGGGGGGALGWPELLGMSGLLVAAAAARRRQIRRQSLQAAKLLP